MEGPAAFGVGRDPAGSSAQRLPSAPMNLLLERAVAAQERRFGVPMAYLRRIAGASTVAFAKFGLFVPLANHRSALPADVWHVARIAATQAADCGTCVQTTVNAARLDGVPLAVVRAALAADTPAGDGAANAALGADGALARRFGHAVAADTPDRSEVVAAVAERFGEAGQTELALAVATVLVFPTLKRGLGLDVACSLTPPTIPGEAP